MKFEKTNFIEPLEEALLNELHLRRIVENASYLCLRGDDTTTHLEIEISEEFGILYSVEYNTARKLNMATLDESIDALASLGYAPAVSYVRKQIIDSILQDLA